MPYKAKSPCRHPGCGKLASGGYCEAHKKIHNKEYNDWHRGYKSGERYDWKWRKIRARYVKAHPLCEMCLEAGRLVPVAEVHHIKPKSEGGSDDVENLMSLCHSCHMKIHGVKD